MAETVPQYDDLEIRLERAGRRSYRVIATATSGGKAEARFTKPFEDRDVENLVLRVGRARRRARAYGSAEMEQAKEFGSRLFNALINGDVRSLYQDARATCEAEDRGLRLTLALNGVPDLMDVPWEFLYDRPQFLSQSVWTPLVRTLDFSFVRPPRRVDLPLRVLGIVSRPSGWYDLDDAAEKMKLETALSPLTATGVVEIDWLEVATTSCLEERVGKPDDIHIVHFIGHGKYQPARQTGVLLFEDDDGNPHEVTGDDMCSLIADEKSLRLVVLNSCEGARTSHVDPFSGVASSLLSCAIPAVIGMQFEITDEAAIKFGGRLYGALADGYPVDAALAQARKGIVAGGMDIEFATPVLFLRGKNATRLFDIHGESQLPARPLAHDGVDCDMTLELVELDHLPNGTARWQLSISNTGDCDLVEVSARNEAGEEVTAFPRLEPGKRGRFRWTDLPEGGHLITVTAMGENGSPVVEQVASHLATEKVQPKVSREETRAEPELVVEPALAVRPKRVSPAKKAARTRENRDLVRDAANILEYTVYPTQLKLLQEAIDGDDRLLAMCRCARDSNVFRSTVLLITSRKLAWSYEAALTSATAGHIYWTQLSGASSKKSFLSFGSELILKAKDGAEHKFSQLADKGVVFENGKAMARSEGFDGQGVAEMITALL